MLQNGRQGADQLTESFEQISTASSGRSTGEFDIHVQTNYPGQYGGVPLSLDEGIERNAYRPSDCC